MTDVTAKCSRHHTTRLGHSGIIRSLHVLPHLGLSCLLRLSHRPCDGGDGIHVISLSCSYVLCAGVVYLWDEASNFTNRYPYGGLIADAIAHVIH